MTFCKSNPGGLWLYMSSITIEFMIILDLEKYTVNHCTSIGMLIYQRVYNIQAEWPIISDCRLLLSRANESPPEVLRRSQTGMGSVTPIINLHFLSYDIIWPYPINIITFFITILFSLHYTWFAIQIMRISSLFCSVMFSSLIICDIHMINMAATSFNQLGWVPLVKLQFSTLWSHRYSHIPIIAG